MNRAPLRILLWGQEIGRLMWDPARRKTYFTYNREMLDSPWAVSPLMPPVSRQNVRMPIYSMDGRIYQNLPSFLADSLPDDWGNQLFEMWRKDRRISPGDITPLEKLSFIGKKGMGALEFMPEIESVHGVGNIDVVELSRLAHRIFVEREEAHILPEESLSLQALIAVGTSAGGRQPKAVIAINHETNEIRSGQIAGQEGFEYYILKFGDPSRCSTELEMTYYELVVKAGIDMMPCRLMKMEGVQHFLTKRFDRQNGAKQHIQTLAAVFPEAVSYDQLLFVCRKMRLSEKASEEVFRRMVFNILANNTDDHNKNFSFLMDSSGKWSLSPAYDMTYIFNRGGFLPEEEHCLSVGGKLSNITKDDVLAFAEENGIRQPEKIISEVASALLNFRELAVKNGVREEWIGRVEDTVTKHLADWGYSTEVPSKYSFTVGEHNVTDVYVEQAYQGNYHLFATIDGNAKKRVIRTKMKEYEMIAGTGLKNLGMEKLSMLVQDLLL